MQTDLRRGSFERVQQVHAADRCRNSVRNPILWCGGIPPALHYEAGECSLSGMR